MSFSKSFPVMGKREIGRYEDGSSEGFWDFCIILTTYNFHEPGK